MVYINLSLIITKLSELGSGEGHTAYFYKRINIPKTSSISESSESTESTNEVLLPARIGFEEVDEYVICDPCFLEGIKQAVEKVSVTKSRIDSLLSEHLNSGRCLRTRKSTTNNTKVTAVSNSSNNNDKNDN
jgi:hypothetical protein